MRHIRLIQSRFVCILVIVACLLCGCRPSTSTEYDFTIFQTASRTDYGIRSANNVQADVEIPTEYNGSPVTYILREAFYSAPVFRLKMESIEMIYDAAFMHCTFLREVDLGKVETIDYRAFLGCYSLETITIPKTVTRIGSDAFLWTYLDSVYFEGSPEYIGRDVFDAGTVLYGPSGSTVEEYAKENGLEFRVWQPESD